MVFVLTYKENGQVLQASRDIEVILSSYRRYARMGYNVSIGEVNPEISKLVEGDGKNG